MSTYLELTQQLVAELGIGGANNGATVPDSVNAQTGQLWNAANWIKWAHNNICLLHIDWNFLAFEYSETLVVGDRNVPSHSGSETPHKYNRTAWWLNQLESTAKQLGWMDWPEFRDDILVGASTRSNSKPSYIAEKPIGGFVLDNPPDDTYTLTGEGWKRPTVLTNDSDTPDVPEVYERIIICEASIKYGNKEAAIEIIQGMEAEYLYLMTSMEAGELPMHESDRIGSEDFELAVGIPGYHEDPRRTR